MPLWFLRASAMLKHVIAIGLTSVRPSCRPSVRPSVRPSHAGTLSKRLNILSCFLHHTIAHSQPIAITCFSIADARKNSRKWKSKINWTVTCITSNWRSTFEVKRSKVKVTRSTSCCPSICAIGVYNSRTKSHRYQVGSRVVPASRTRHATLNTTVTVKVARFHKARDAGWNISVWNI